MSDVHNSDKPQPSQGENLQGTGPNTVEGSASPTPPTPWYARPWFWGLVFFLGILALLIWLFWLQWQAHLAHQEREAALILEQEKRHAELEAEKARLKALLAEEPCIIKEKLPSISVPHMGGASDMGGTKGEPLQIPKGQGQNNTSPKATPEAAPNSKPTSEAEAPPPPPPVDSSTAASTDMAQRLEKATVLILADEPTGLQMGTGFFVAPGIVLTNQHVVGSGKGSVYVIGTFAGTVAQAKVLAISPNAKRDYAVLQVPVTDVVPLSLNTQVQRTQKISTWGFPSAVTSNDPKLKNLLNGTDKKAPDVIYSEGTVSVIQDQDPKLIVHTAVVSQGNSGGPLVDAQGHVVGINTYIHMDKESYRQSSLSIVAEDIIKFLKEHNIPYTLAATPQE